MSDAKKMAGDYEVIQSIRVRGQTMLMGYAPDNRKATYMTCYERFNILGETRYTDAVGGAEYLPIFKEYQQRIQQETEKLEQELGSRGVPVSVLDAESCRKRNAGESLEGKLVVISPERLAPEYRRSDYQLGIAISGFGCQEKSRGRAVYFQELYSGESSRWDSCDVLGIADLEKIPDWAKEKLAELQKQAEKKHDRSEAR